MEIIHYDLFAGIGGFSLALDSVFNPQEYETKHIFAEWEAFPSAVLKKHWPEGIYYGDIKDLVADTDRKGWEGKWQQHKGRHGLLSGETPNQEQEMVVITGGFPCQPFSQAGRRAGTSDDRYKWPEMLAVIKNVKPDWIIAENVRGLITWNNGLVFETVCSDLESEGYEVQPLIIPACAIGAPHRRDRVWIIAHSINNRQRGEKRGGTESQNRVQKIDRTKDSATRKSKRTTSYRPINRYEFPNWSRAWQEVALATCHDGVDDGIPRQMGGVTISQARHRKEQLKAYGNAIVPQVAIEIFKAIKKSNNQQTP